MNIENINKLADALDALEDSPSDIYFDMKQWGGGMVIGSLPFDIGPGIDRINHCGAPGCIAGWAKFLFAPVGPVLDNETPLPFATKFLGLNAELANRLFIPNELDMDDEEAAALRHDDDTFFDPKYAIVYDNAGPRNVAKVLRYLAYTGEVDWRTAWVI